MAQLAFHSIDAEPTGEHVRIRWQGTLPSKVTSSAYWERDSTVNGFTISSSASGRSAADLALGSDDPVAGQVRFTTDGDTLTVDAFIEIKLKTKPFWPGETITCTVPANFLACSQGGHTTAPSPVGYQRVIDRVGIVPFTNWFDPNRIPKAALWCETGASQIVDSLTTGPLSMTLGLLDRGQVASTRRLLPPSTDQQPLFTAATDDGTRRGALRAYLRFDGQNDAISIAHQAAFNTTESCLLLGVAFRDERSITVQGPPSYIIGKGATSDTEACWWVRRESSEHPRRIYIGVSPDGSARHEVFFDVPAELTPPPLNQVAVLIVRIGPSAIAPDTMLVETWINGRYTLLTLTGVGSLNNSSAPIVVGASNESGADAFLGRINEVYFSPTYAGDAAVACLMHEMLRRWDIQIQDMVFQPPASLPFANLKRNPVAEINCFGAGYKSGDSLTGQAPGWFDVGQGIPALVGWLNTEYGLIKESENPLHPENVFDIMIRLPGGRVAGDIMPSDPLAYTTSDQRAALAEWINTAKEKNGATASFTGSEPPRALWVYTGCGLPYDYATDEYGYGAAGSRSGSHMQNRVLAPITHESWFTEHNNRWTSIHPLLKNYICDAASLQFRRFIGIAHNPAFNATKMLILEAMLPREHDAFRAWAAFYCSLRFKQATWWWETYPDELVFKCSSGGLVDPTFALFGTGGQNNSQNVNTTGCPSTTPPPTPPDERMYMTAAQVKDMKLREAHGPDQVPVYIPLARPGNALGISYCKRANDGWFIL